MPTSSDHETRVAPGRWRALVLVTLVIGADYAIVGPYRLSISGLTFWVYHWVSFERVTSPHHLGAGLLLAWSYERSRSLLAPTILHAIGNLVLGTSDLVYVLWPQWVHSMLGWS